MSPTKPKPGQKHVSRIIRLGLLCLPFLIFCLALIPLEVSRHQRQELQKLSYIHGQIYGRYLYSSYKIEALLSERQKVENYYCVLAKIDSPDTPYVVVRYLCEEADEVEAQLKHLPNWFNGRIDTATGEDHEFFMKYWVRPALEQGYPKSLEDRIYYVFNISSFDSSEKYRTLILVLIGLLLLLPFFSELARIRRSRLRDRLHNGLHSKLPDRRSGHAQR